MPAKSRRITGAQSSRAMASAAPSANVASPPDVALPPNVASHPAIIHPVVENYFHERGWKPFGFQRNTWEAYAQGKSGLVHAATGTGKSLSVFFGPVMEWMREAKWQGDSLSDGRAATQGLTPPPLQLLWITPLRALAADLEARLAETILRVSLPWSLQARTGDTKASIRNKQKARLPTALITTPESLTLLLSYADAKERFQHLQCVIVDEWHELMGSKRGVLTELALARLRSWRPQMRTWGLSATLGNLQEAAETLVGRQDALLIPGDVPKSYLIECLLPEDVERFPWGGHLGSRLTKGVAEVLERYQTSLVFANTRSQAELWYRAILAEKPEWAGLLAIHHGSLDQEVRNWVEDGLRTQKLRCCVATSSLDLGVDFTAVDHVIQVGSPKGIARLLQRVGRSGHQPGALSRLTFVPTHAMEIVEIAAARSAIDEQKIESREPLRKPLDVLAQHLVTIACAGGFEPQAMLAEVRTAPAYRDLTDLEWSWVLDFVRQGGSTLGAYPEFRRVVWREDKYEIPDDRMARRHRMAIGVIASEASIVVAYVSGGRIGTVEEGLVSRLQQGDKFLLGGKLLEFVRLNGMTAQVRKAQGSPNAVPRWMGGRLPLSTELADAFRAKLDEANQSQFRGVEMEAARPLLVTQAKLSCLPGPGELLIELMETREGWHLTFYPMEGRAVHEGLAALFSLRLSRFKPISFSMAVNDYGFVLSSPQEPPLTEALANGLFSSERLADDILSSLNATEMAKRRFRDIARVAGLVHGGYPGQGKTARQLQASSDLFYDVFVNYDPGNMLLHQARREVLELQLEHSRLKRTLDRLQTSTLRIETPRQITPFAFPLIVDRLREKLTSEKLADRVRRMQKELEKSADSDAPPQRKANPRKKA